MTLPVWEVGHTRDAFYKGTFKGKKKPRAGWAIFVVYGGMAEVEKENGRPHIYNDPREAFRVLEREFLPKGRIQLEGRA
ncbi:MAG: hypothetical protein MPK62_02255 [Alphaproteobacteria bacterium]|nr:hypothetical protein [Alphaproteobacteria bacterium]MDA8029957.1 hypothetical protein [Alphaproteobacteria bacterium]